MEKSSADDIRYYLTDYLEEEFRDYPGVRVRIMPEDKEEGVSVKTSHQEYFFPFTWAEQKQFREIDKLVAKIKDRLSL